MCFDSFFVTGIIRIHDLYQLHELQLHVRALPQNISANRTANSCTSRAVIQQVIFVNHPGLHRSGPAVPAELGALLQKLTYLMRVIFDVDWDDDSAEAALSSWQDSVRLRTEVIAGGESA